MSTRQLARIALVGPIAFAVVVAILTAVQLDFLRGMGWDAIGASDVAWPSSTALGPYGWAQVLNFLLLGVSLLALTAGLSRVLEPIPRVGLASLGAFGAAILLSAFKTDGSATTFTTWHGAIHFVAFFAFLVAAAVSQIALGVSLRRRPAWRGEGRYSLAALALTLLFLVGSFAIPAAGSLLASLALLTNLVWVELLAFRLASEAALAR